jgi:hypothetical protein
VDIFHLLLKSLKDGDTISRDNREIIWSYVSVQISFIYYFGYFFLHRLLEITSSNQYFYCFFFKA